MEQLEAMTSFQARLNLLVFILIAVLISANALYLQDSAHSSKKQVVKKQTIREIPKRNSSIRIIPSKPEETTSSISEEKPVEKQIKDDDENGVITADTVKAIQRELKTKGYSPGLLDGAPGLETRAAILAFEYDMGLPLTATPSEDVLRKIIFGFPNKQRKKGARNGETATSKHVVKVVQKMLLSLGYAAGHATGDITRDTQLAIKEFETNRRLKVTGRVSGRLIQELMKVTDIPTGR